MKTLTLLYAVFLIASFGVNAQSSTNKIPVHLDSDRGSANAQNFISLKSLSLQALTPDTSVVGYIADTLSNATFTLVPETQITRWLQSYTDLAYAPSFSDTGKPVFCWIKNFSLSESITSQNVYIHLEASLFMNGFGDLSSQTLVDTLLKSPHTGGIDYSIPFENALHTLTQLAANKASAYPAQISQTHNFQKRANTQQLRDYSGLPIMSDSVINEGAFQTLRQLANNTPALTNIFMRLDTSSTNGWVKVYRLNTDSSVQEVTSLVAVCIGGELYAYRNHRLIAIERTNNSMLISRYRDPDLRLNSASYMRWILSDSPGNENPFAVEYKCTTPGNEDVVATCMDLDTGDLSF